MNATGIANLMSAVQAARQAAQNDLSGCDVGDIEELIVPIDRELRSGRPNTATLSTYLNSLARSLRSDPEARSVCLELDAAMRDAGIETHWEET